MSDYTPLIDPRDLRIYRVPSDKAKLYRDNGWADPETNPEPQVEALKKDLSGWYDNGQAVAFTFARGIPLATKALSATVDKGTFQNLALKAKIFDENHPLTSKLLQIGGGLATIPIGGAIGKGIGLAAKGLGIGAEAAGLGAEAAAAGEGIGAAAGETGAAAETTALARTGAAEAEGAGAAADAELGATPLREPIVEPPVGVVPEAEATAYRQAYASDIADAEIVDPGAAASGVDLGADGAGLGASAPSASGGGTLASLLSKTPQAVTKAAKLGAIGAAQNVAFGAAYRVDNQALEHALDPQGQEKLAFEANDVLLDAALGAALPVGLGGLGNALGAVGKKLKDKSITMFRAAVLKGDMLDAALSQGREGSLYRMLDKFMGKGEREIASALYIEQKNAEQSMEVIKARYKKIFVTDEMKASILQEVERIAGTKQDPVYQAISARLKKKIDLGGLQGLAKDIDKSPHIVWNDPEFAKNPRNLLVRDARDVIARAQRAFIRDNGITGVEDAIQWERINQQSSDAQLILGSLASKRGIGVEELFQKLGVSAAAGAALGATGLAGAAGPLAAGAQTAGWQAVRHLRIKHVAPFVNKLGKVLLSTDQKIANVLDGGLRGVPGQVHKLYTSPDYDSTAAAVSLAARDPAKTIQNLQTHYNEAGIPQEISMPIVQTQAAALSHLGKSLPARNDAPDISTTDTGDPVQQHRWLDQVKTFQDPTYGLANPTADNLRILKQFYPQTLYTAQQALYGQISKNPNLPSEARAWASRLLERPLTNLDSPTFAQTLAQARQANQVQAPGPKAQRGGGSQNAVESSLTRADQLQNR